MGVVTKKSATAANLVQMTKSFIENLKNPYCKCIDFEIDAGATANTTITLPFKLDLSVPYPILSIGVINEGTANFSCRLQDENAENELTLSGDTLTTGSLAPGGGDVGFKIGAADAATRTASSICLGIDVDAGGIVRITAVWAPQQTLSA